MDCSSQHGSFAGPDRALLPARRSLCSREYLYFRTLRAILTFLRCDIGYSRRRTALLPRPRKRDEPQAGRPVLHLLPRLRLANLPFIVSSSLMGEPCPQSSLPNSSTLRSSSKVSRGTPTSSTNAAFPRTVSAFQATALAETSPRVSFSTSLDRTPRSPSPDRKSVV